MLLLALALLAAPQDVERTFEPAPSPPDNPMRGLVPYVGAGGEGSFPHSLEFRYFPLSAFVVGPGEHDWKVLEDTLAITKARGCQLVLRVFTESPGREDGIPPFLLEDGLGVTRWEHDDKVRVTPDYEDAGLRRELTAFIEAFGERYDGDPRIGFVTGGLLGAWGEWHSWPREELFASADVQEEVLAAYESAFEVTPILLRYPSRGGAGKARNVGRGFGFHDDSFGWATLATGRPEHSWYFMSLLEAAGAVKAGWSVPIGGEIRPELWPGLFTDAPHPRAQDFDECVRRTRVSWLMDSAMFGGFGPVTDERRARAEDAIRGMGYELHVPRVEWNDGERSLTFTLQNLGVAPFYSRWPMVLQGLRDGRVIASMELPRLSAEEPGVLVGNTVPLGRSWSGLTLRLSLPNPMEGGRPVVFATEGAGPEGLVLLTLP